LPEVAIRGQFTIFGWGYSYRSSRQPEADSGHYRMCRLRHTAIPRVLSRVHL